MSDNRAYDWVWSWHHTVALKTLPIKYKIASLILQKLCWTNLYFIINLYACAIQSVSKHDIFFLYLHYKSDKHNTYTELTVKCITLSRECSTTTTLLYEAGEIYRTSVCVCSSVHIEL